MVNIWHNTDDDDAMGPCIPDDPTPQSQDLGDDALREAIWGNSTSIQLSNFTTDQLLTEIRRRTQGR